MSSAAHVGIYANDRFPEGWEIVPSYATKGSACFDLHAAYFEQNNEGEVIIGTGLHFELPEDHVMLIFSRSGMGFKQNLRLANCVGVVDSDYRGEVKIKLVKDILNLVTQYEGIKTHKDGTTPTLSFRYYDHVVKIGDRIAQAMVLPIPRVYFSIKDTLEDTKRGTSGFGSTGK